MIKHLDVRVRVTTEGEIILPPMPELPPGDYDAVLIVDAREHASTRGTLHLPVLDVGPWPKSNPTFRREELYGDAD